MRDTAENDSISLADVLRKLERFREERDWKQFHRPRDLAAAISIEASELQELFLWQKDDEIEEALEAGDLADAVSSEIADILIFCLYFLQDLERDPLKVIVAKLKKNRDRYPVDRARGNSQKYTEL